MNEKGELRVVTAPLKTDVGVQDGIRLCTALYKLSRIDDIYATCPLTNVICLGDSQQYDPEVYGEAFRRHPP